MKQLDKCQRDCRNRNPLAGRTLVLRCGCGEGWAHLKIGWDGCVTWDDFWRAYQRLRRLAGCHCSLADVWRGHELIFDGWGNPVRIVPAYPLASLPPEEIDTGEVL